MKIFEWIIENKEWFFSGIGVFILGLILSLVYSRKKSSISQNISSGNNSLNIQTGNTEIKSSEKR